eukprot:CAMPEP_0179262288 /NCGR_PEP_ID=MMETSP0797-20121207/27292_1 /TAXON_ID=47934 /ORGANISM="Dinophysis acuminata, Strain DAEP01" /LENGTH=237 /DNA_ID=CAMNT_0020970423 /DNA_START=49 /DNA_END=759 /DNA_ORIENTATION=+
MRRRVQAVPGRAGAATASGAHLGGPALLLAPGFAPVVGPSSDEILSRPLNAPAATLSVTRCSSSICRAAAAALEAPCAILAVIPYLLSTSWAFSTALELAPASLSVILCSWLICCALSPAFSGAHLGGPALLLAPGFASVFGPSIDEILSRPLDMPVATLSVTWCFSSICRAAAVALAAPCAIFVVIPYLLLTSWAFSTALELASASFSVILCSWLIWCAFSPAFSATPPAMRAASP